MINNNLHLISLFPQTGEDFGLYQGKMGECMFHFILSRKHSCERSYNHAQDLFDAISDKASVLPINFGAGLLGIGWATEWLVSKSYIEINTDEFLEDLDDLLFKRIMYKKNDFFDFDNGLLGQIVYFEKRINSDTKNLNFYRQICNRECLTLLVDELYERVYNGRTLENSNPMEICQILCIASRLHRCKVNFELLNKIINKTILHVKDLQKKNNLSEIELLYLNYGLSKISLEIFDNKLELETIGFISDYKDDLKKINRFFLNQNIEDLDEISLLTAKNKVFNLLHNLNFPDSSWAQGWGF